MYLFEIHFGYLINCQLHIEICLLMQGFQYRPVVFILYDHKDQSLRKIVFLKYLRGSTCLVSKVFLRDQFAMDIHQ